MKITSNDENELILKVLGETGLAGIPKPLSRFLYFVKMCKRLHHWKTFEIIKFGVRVKKMRLRENLPTETCYDRFHHCIPPMR